MRGLFMTVNLKSVGSLFDFVSDEALGVDVELALEGRARGWRS
jgi:hypothetical protein